MSLPRTPADLDAAPVTDEGRQERLAKLADLLGDTHVAMLTTVEADGTLRSRPMGLQLEDEFDGTLWFFTRAGAPKTDQIEADSDVNVAVARPDDQTYISMAGHAAVVNDRAQIEARWSESARPWFPDGPEDDALRLLRVDVHRAEYWDSPSSVLVLALGYAKARLTGEAFDASTVGENEKVDL